MYYHDLTSIQVVDDLPMPEFNLRMHCVMERVGWGLGYFGGTAETESEPKPEMRPVGKKSLIEVLQKMQMKKIAEENK